MDQRYRFIGSAIGSTVAIVGVVALILLLVPFSYNGSVEISFASVNFSDNMSDSCTKPVPACIWFGEKIFLQDEAPPLRQYIYCSHEKMHAIHPSASHGSSEIDSLTFNGTIGWHPECAALAFKYH